MFLAIDIGNSQTVVGLFEGNAYFGDEFTSVWRFESSRQETAREIRSTVGENLDQISAIVISSVVPAQREWFEKEFAGMNLQWIDSKWNFSFEMDVDHPEQVGVDRLVNAEAAIRDYAGAGSPLIIVDSGTATTVCAVGGEAAYRGGAIMPGMRLSVEALAAKAEQLYTVDLVTPPSVIGRDTSKALQSGMIYGYSSMIEGMIQRFQKELGGRARVVATGGVIPLLEKLLPSVDVFDPQLTLKGIGYLYESQSV